MSSPPPVSVTRTTGSGPPSPRSRLQPHQDTPETLSSVEVLLNVYYQDLLFCLNQEYEGTNCPWTLKIKGILTVLAKMKVTKLHLVKSPIMDLVNTRCSTHPRGAVHSLARRLYEQWGVITRGMQRPQPKGFPQADLRQLVVGRRDLYLSWDKFFTQVRPEWSTETIEAWKTLLHRRQLTAPTSLIRFHLKSFIQVEEAMRSSRNPPPRTRPRTTHGTGPVGRLGPTGPAPG